MPKKIKSSRPVDSNDNIVYSASVSTSSSSKHNGKSKKAQLCDVDALYRQPSSSSVSSCVSQFVAPIINGHQTKLNGNTTTWEHKAKLPVLTTTHAFESNISASEPNLLTDVHLHAPLARPRNGYANGLKLQSNSENLHALHNNTFAVKHDVDDLTNYVTSPVLNDASIIFDDEDDTMTRRATTRDQLDNATLNVEDDSVFYLPLHSSLKQWQRIDRLELEMVLPRSPQTQKPIVTPSAPGKRRKAFRSMQRPREKFKQVQKCYSFVEDAVLSFEDEMERQRSMPAHIDRHRFIKHSRTELRPEQEPEEIYDQSIKAYRHRPAPAVPQTYFVKRNDATRRYDKRVCVLPLQDMRYEEKTNETVYTTKSRAAQKRLILHVEKAINLEDASPLILPDATNFNVSGNLIRELRHLFEDCDDVDDSSDSDSSLVNAVKDLVSTKEPLPYLMMPPVRSADGTEHLFQVCPSHLAPNVEDELLPARQCADTPKLDARNSMAPFDRDGIVHHFHYAFIPFNIYRNWLKHQPQFVATVQRPVLLHDDLARSFVPLPANVHFAKVHHFAYEKVSEVARHQVAHVKVSVQQRSDVSVASVSKPVAVVRRLVIHQETVNVNVVQHRLKSERRLDGLRKPILVRVVENDLSPSSTQYIVVASRNSSWNPFYKQSHGLVKDCGVGTMDEDELKLKEFEIDPNVIDALFEESDSDDDVDDESTIGKDSGTSTDHYASPHCSGASVSTGSLTAVHNHEAYCDDSRPPSVEEAHVVVKLSARARYK